MRFGVFDLETKGLGGDIVLVGVYDGDKFKTFKNLPDAVTYMETDFHTRLWYAHYAGGYDFRYFLDSVNVFPRVDIPSMLIINGKLITFKTKSGAEFRDSFALMPQSLEALGRSFGCGGKHKYTDYQEHKDIPKLKRYLRRDCVLLYDVIEKLADALPIEPKLTIAATALRVWRSMYPKHWKHLRRNKLSRGATEFARLGYYGGRVEVFRQYGEGLFYYDVNSMYPSAMLEKMPWGKWALLYREIRPAFDADLPGLYDIEITVPAQMYIPPLPIRHAGKLVFPTGKLRGIWALPEIRYAESLGCTVRRVWAGLVFSQREAIFTDYVNRFWLMKSEATGAKRTIAKLLLNSLYGKFGQRTLYSEIIGEAGRDKAVEAGKEIGVFDSRLGIYTVSRESWRQYIRPEIAAYVTALARVKLHQGMSFAIQNGARLYYCDTDSMTLDAPVVETSAGLGGWGAPDHIQRGVFLAPKTYALETKPGEVVLALKGIPKESVGDFGFDSALDILHGRKRSVNITAKRLVGIREATQRLETRKSVHRYRAMVNRSRKIEARMDKRELIADFDTRPLSVKHWG